MSINVNGSYQVRNTGGLSSRTLTNNKTYDYSSNATPWTRNKSWLTFTAPTAIEEKFIGLHAIHPDANFLALSAAGNYTVNWGDGVVENFVSGVVAYHEYSYSDVDLANTNAPVTFQDTTNTVTRTSHGYVDGDKVSFYNIVTTTGLSEATPYYVISATSGTFQVSLTLGGSALNLTSDGSATLLPYKQAIVQVYPQAGQNLTSLNLQKAHTSLPAGYTSGFLDIALSGALLTDLRINNTTPGILARDVRMGLLEQVNIVRTDCRQLHSLLSVCDSLQSVLNLGTSLTPAATMAVTFTDSTDTVNSTAHGFRNGDMVAFKNIIGTTGLFASTFYFVINASADTFQLSNDYGGPTAVSLTTDGSAIAVRGTVMINLFTGSYSLTTVPLFDTSAVTSMQSMFTSCSLLTTVPLFDTSAVISMQSMFSLCGSLTTVPLFNTAAVTFMQSMFQNCSSLTTVPLFNTAAVTVMTGMFSSCFSLKTVPLFNTVAVTTMSSMFAFCYSLTTVPLFNTAAVTTMSGMFSSCYSLTTVPLFNTSAVTNMSNMFSSCTSLKTVPLFNTAAVTTMSGMFNGCYSLTTVPLFNTVAVTTMSSMFQNCSSLTTVPLFNTAAVTFMTGMFNNCYSLTTVPLFTVGAVNMASMFNNCTSLTTVPLFNTVAVTVMQSMFNGCYSLKTVPLLNTAAVTSMSSMFNNCTSLTTVPALVVSAGTSLASYSSLFSGCYSLSQIKAIGFKFTFSVANCKLSATALNEIYTNLPTVTSQTITVTNNYGAATDNPAIATAKGWTVTG